MGELIDPVDVFDGLSVNRFRIRCNDLADIMQVQGPFEPHGCTTLIGIDQDLKKPLGPDPGIIFFANLVRQVLKDICIAVPGDNLIDRVCMSKL
jgi:hypothetical protein